MSETIQGFVLTSQWRDAPGGVALTYWLASERGPLRVHFPRREAVMFVDRDVEARCHRRRQVELRSMRGSDVDALYFSSRRDLLDERDRLRRETATYESDVRPSERFLMERFTTGGCIVNGTPRQRRGYLELIDPGLKRGDYRPELSVMSFDIETDGIDGEVLSIAAVCGNEERVLMVGASTSDRIEFVPNERALLSAFFDLVSAKDPDVLIGWNVVEFDLAHLQRRAEAHSLRLALGRGGERAAILPAQREGQLAIARVPGRAVVDGIGALKSATYSFESFTLEAVSQELLGRGKAIHDEHKTDRIGEIRRMFDEDKEALAAYNLEDCRLVTAIFHHTDLLSFCIERQRMTGLPMGRVGGSVAAFDNLYLPRLHRHRCVAYDVGAVPPGITSPGGYVLQSDPGLYDNVLVLDFKSLYPSIIRTFKIDPLGLAFPGEAPIEGFDGGRFSRDEHILPEVIANLWADRDQAKRDDDATLSRAIKILMNSFYGVLGTPGCRFADPKLVSSITRRGHQIITESRDWIHEHGWRVIYGDTDSLFVLIGKGHSAEECDAAGNTLAADLNLWWRTRVAAEHRTDSFLEVEFETHYQRFFMPTLRGSNRGSAKRYAGLVDAVDRPKVVVKGLEAVRTDWTPLAREFQRELLRRVFLDEPWREYIQTIRQQLFRGELDAQLVYHKRLRRSVDEYVANTPPHVKAARMLGEAVREVRYLMTARGPQPTGLQNAPIDYHHYLDKQLAPAADALLACFGTDFASIAGDQLRLF